MLCYIHEKGFEDDLLDMRVFFYRSYDFHDLYVDGAVQIAKIAKEMGVERLIHFSHLNADPKRTDLIHFGDDIPKGNSMLQKKVKSNFNWRIYFYL